MLYLLLLATAVAGTPLEDQAYLDAFDAARKHQRNHFLQARATYGQGPLLPYIDFAWLYYNTAKVPSSQVRQFLRQYADLPVARLLRQRWLHHLGKKKRWGEFLQFWQTGADNDSLRCYHLRARIATGRLSGSSLRQALEDLWLAPYSLPKACDPLLHTLRKRGWLSQTLIWKRFDSAMRSGQTRLARWLAMQLKPRRRLAQDWLRIHQRFNRLARKARQWPDTPLHRGIVLHELAAHAVSRPEASRKLLQRLNNLNFSPEELLALRSRTALYAATDQLPQARAWLQQALTAREDPTLRRWSLRLAMVDGDWWDFLHQWSRLPETDRQDNQWLYWKAHALEATGQNEPARHLFLYLSRKSSYYGFLAADHLKKPYNLCPQPSGLDLARMQRLLDLPSVQRMLALRRIDQAHYANLELNRLLEHLSEPDRHQLALVLDDEGWHAAAIRLLTHMPRLYQQRFPMPYRATIEQAASSQQLPASLLLAIIRAESAFDPRARSPVGARGLMQIMPAIGRQLAHRLGHRPWKTALLDRPAINIRLGSRHLNDYLHRLRHPVAAIAAYNAGPERVARWLQLPSAEDTLLWMETLPFGETRDYLRKVLAYQVIYQWRLRKRSGRISSWLTPLGQPYPRANLVQPATIPFWCQSELPMPANTPQQP